MTICSLVDNFNIVYLTPIMVEYNGFITNSTKYITLGFVNLVRYILGGFTRFPSQKANECFGVPSHFVTDN